MPHPAALALVLALAAGPSRPEPALRLGNLRLVHQGAVSYLQAHCQQFGVAVQETIYPGGQELLPDLVSGQLDLAAVAIDTAVAARAGGGRILLVAGVAKGGARLVGRTDLALRLVSDLKGHVVGVARDGALELPLLAELSKARLNWSEQPGRDVQLLYLPAAELNPALREKRIDAMCQGDPRSTQAVAGGYGVEMLRPYDTALGEPARVLVMSERLVQERPATAEKVLECFVDATRTFQRHPALAERYVREQLFKGQLSAEEYAEAMSNATLTLEVPLDHVQRTTDLMVLFGVGRIAIPPRPADWVRPELLERATARLAERPGRQ